ncbi:MAG: 5'-nucleotidase, partial [Elusimicrobia bacterium]
RSASGTAAGAAMTRLGVKAVVPGAAEWARLDEILAGHGGDRTLYLAANLKAAPGVRTLPGRTVFEAGGQRVGVFGLSAEANGRSLSGGNARSYELTDPLEAARDAAAALRAESDVVVALTNLTPSQNARLRARVPGIDVIVGDSLPSDPDAELETLTADDPERGPEDAALLVTADAPAVVTHLTLRYDDIGEGRYGLGAREERLPLDESVPDLPGFAPFHYEAYGVDSSQAPPLLPAVRRLSADGRGSGGLKDLDFWRLAASLTAESFGAEAAFLPVQPVEERTTGDFREGIVRSWFVSPDRVVVVQLSGGELARLLSDARRTESPDASIPPGGLRLAVGGVGKGETIHGVGIDHRSSYRVALTERVLAQSEQFASLKGASASETGPALEESVVTGLRAASQAAWPPERYRSLFSGAPMRESGLWRINFRDVNVNVSNTKVVSEPALAGVSNARIRGFDELLIGGVSKTDAEYVSGRAKWTNSLELEYARSRLRPPGQREILSTPKNSLEARTSAALSVAKFPVAWVAASVGPSFGVEYEGELERLPYTRRKHKVSVLPGVELFNGTLLRTVSLSANLQRDFTPPSPVNQYGARLRALLAAPVAGAMLAGELGTRYFFLTPHDTPADLRLELEASVKL